VVYVRHLRTSRQPKIANGSGVRPGDSHHIGQITTRARYRNRRCATLSPVVWYQILIRELRTPSVHPSSEQISSSRRLAASEWSYGRRKEEHRVNVEYCYIFCSLSILSHLRVQW